MKITMAMSDMAVIKEIYERLEAIRQAKGLSQEALAENLGISRPTYSRLQKGTCSLSIFIGVLRELSLLEGLDNLVPALTLRPSEIIKKTQRRVARSKDNFSLRKPQQVRASSIDKIAAQSSVGAMLANRKKLKVSR